MNYDDYKTDNGRDTFHPRETRDSSCVKCGVQMTVVYDYVGQPWCPRCNAIDLRVAAKKVSTR
jgi:hypothetical protein